MLDRLTANEQRALLELLIYMAKSDGQVDDIEGVVLQQYADVVSVEFDTLDGDLSPEELVPQLERPASRVIALQELLRLSHLNGILNQDEQSAIIEVAAEMGVPMELLRKVDAWVLEDIRQSIRSEEILKEADKVVRR